MHIKTVEPPN